MALEIVKLDSRTLPSIADAIRAKTGNTALLLPSQMVGAISSIKTLHIETGTITLAANSAELTLPRMDMPKMITVEATETAENTIVGGNINATLAVRGLMQAIQIGDDDALEQMIALQCIVHRSIGVHAMGSANVNAADTIVIKAVTGYPWCAGAEYRWTAYYWEDTV